MKKNKPVKILVLGANGKLGRVVYSYLSLQKGVMTFGTYRKIDTQKNIFKLEVKDFKKDIKIILNEIGNIDYAINCIATLSENASRKELTFVNSIFPKKLSELAEKNNFFLIHISTDGVFSANSKGVSELSMPHPDTFYGKSKLLGEPKSKNSITLRTSLIGFDPDKKMGLLEWVINNKKIKGFINQKWSGATVLQIAKFIDISIKNNYFKSIRKKTSIIHFAPLGPISKYQLLNDFINVFKITKQIEKEKAQQITRYLTSIFIDADILKLYTSNTKKVLTELVEFEKNIK